ncbi:MGMT family protein [Bacteroides sp.]
MKDYKVSKETMSDIFCREVYAIVRDIPAGKVLSYGEIATLLGKPQCSRMVGRALKQVPSALKLPCHRVVNAQGRLVPGWDEQRSLLQAEGVCFRKNGTVDMVRCQWHYDE